MNQLDLFVPANTTEPSVAKQIPLQKRQVQNTENDVETNETKKEAVEVKQENFEKGEAYNILFEKKEQEIVNETLRNNIVFEDNNIGVKIKARQNTSDGNNNNPNQLEAKPKPRKTIVNSQPNSAYSIQLSDTISRLKNNIKENLLNENAEKKKKDKENKLPQKRGRKSLKDREIEFDFIDIPEDELLFQKQYYPISEVAGWFKVNTSLLRFWENEFDILKPRKNRKGDRLFRPEDVKNIQIIYQLLRKKKYSIEGAKEYLKTDLNKATSQMQLINTLQKVRGFLLELKANL